MIIKGTFNTIGKYSSQIGGSFPVWSRVGAKYQGGGKIDTTNLSAGDIVKAGTMVVFNGIGQNVTIVDAPALYEKKKYSAGNLCTYENVIYAANQSISTAEDWTSAHWTKLLGGVANIADYSSSATYSVGDLCKHDNKYYTCNTAISTAEAWTAGHWTQTYAYNALMDDLAAVNGLIETDVCIPDGVVIATCAVVREGRIYADRAYIPVGYGVEGRLPMIEFVRE